MRPIRSTGTTAPCWGAWDSHPPPPGRRSRSRKRSRRSTFPTAPPCIPAGRSRSPDGCARPTRSIPRHSGPLRVRAVLPHEPRQLGFRAFRRRRQGRRAGSVTPMPAARPKKMASSSPARRCCQRGGSYLAFERDSAAKELRLYVDGALEAPHPQRSRDRAVGKSRRRGRRLLSRRLSSLQRRRGDCDGTLVNQMNGLLDDAIYWERAVTGGEIAAISAAGPNGLTTDTNRPPPRKRAGMPLRRGRSR